MQGLWTQQRELSPKSVHLVSIEDTQRQIPGNPAGQSNDRQKQIPRTILLKNYRRDLALLTDISTALARPIPLPAPMTMMTLPSSEASFFLEEGAA
ncbi:hypothetical protein [Paenibacillus sp. 8b26]|uniref:hypothetical protein n=1 Tax=Paenibacillus sp. 8b26 TaxID=3424133 RepID=UPI003D64FDF7